MSGKKTPAGDHDRLKIVEEEIGLTELRTEQLDQVVRDLSAQVFELANRLDRLERRMLDQGEDEEVPNEPPPHAHRPL
jgi:uncharacterized coiled-coil protein SlyX